MKQLTLGELIDRLENANLYDPDGDSKKIEFDFCWAEPVGFCSWRGDYSELAVMAGFYGYGHGTQKAIKATDFLKDLKAQVGQTFEGWKGGDYQMHHETRLWVTTHHGNSCYTGITGVSDSESFRIVINTAYFEY